MELIGKIISVKGGKAVVFVDEILRTGQLVRIKGRKTDFTQTIDTIHLGGVDAESAAECKAVIRLMSPAEKGDKIFLED